mmetsp:Transcript_35190/g.78321  ORF Transcript_35190/g.78321 Transcript_35190/m.78321 type:complete len:324 (-) Transcript_35190:55-1026(-)|eukprot:CAMPEP_0202893790 /NCGR_PEP_ID=MMETSP1392-20130828/3297_1 /ASSEMBLY_ACC=CAM_ASM_000868 /TAXON_ID=225041 /ORGANISM="Chlamydomonas chlamydogama, Strain SAG 11-48b" /LENGTH=323 /DNA_ID=CAMNT_0049578241 /DNA_START=51 /DNA_END=1022 /DNA_ORIENTATION=-
MGVAYSNTSGAVLITGASSGIGNYLALHFAGKGWKVYATVRKTSDADAIKRNAPNIRTIIMDVTDEASIKTAVQQVEADLGHAGLDVLINNAGIGLTLPLELTTTESFRNVFQVNVFGAAAVTRHCLPLLRKAVQQQADTLGPSPPSPRILMISSIAGRFCLPYNSVYHASKYAVEALCDTLRLELQPQGIKTICIEPGFTKTLFGDKMSGEWTSTEQGGNSKAQSLYAAEVEKMMVDADRTMDLISIPLPYLARAIHRAATCKWPAARYCIAWHLTPVIWIRDLCNDAVWDWVYWYLDWVHHQLLKGLAWLYAGRQAQYKQK